MTLRVGDKTEVVLGASTLTATVLDIRKIGDRTRVLLSVPVLGTGGEVLDESTVVVPLEDLREPGRC